MAEALQAALKYEIFHGNLFYKNVYIEKDECKLSDLGFANIKLLSNYEQDLVFYPPEKLA